MMRPGLATLNSRKWGRFPPFAEFRRCYLAELIAYSMSKPRR